MTTDVIPVLRVSNAVDSLRWYRRLGFELVFEHRFEPHLPVYAGIRRDGAQIHLSEHAGDANPHGLVYVWVDDIDRVAAEFGVVVDDQPWGREVYLTDPDGNRLRLASSEASALDDDTVAGLIERERAMWTDATRGDRAWMNDHLSDGFTEFGMVRPPVHPQRRARSGDRPDRCGTGGVLRAFGRTGCGAGVVPQRGAARRRQSLVAVDPPWRAVAARLPPGNPLELTRGLGVAGPP